LISFFNEFQLLCEAVSKKHGVPIEMNKISKVVVQTAEGILNPHYGSTSGHAYYGTCLPKDSSELKGLEEEYDLPASMFKSIVDVNNIFVANDKEEVLDGDNHMSFNILSKVSGSSVTALNAKEA
jgi:UDP-glucose 6-dehydrogenase